MHEKQHQSISSNSTGKLVCGLCMLLVVAVHFGCNQDRSSSKPEIEGALSRDHTEKILDKENPRVDRALVIGINNYSSGFKQLKRAVNDARGVRNILVDEFGYDSEDVAILENKSASVSHVKSTLSKLGQNLDSNDTILFFFAGHGQRDGWLAMADSVFDQEEKTWLSVQWLVSAIKDLPCRHKLVILDSCYSGALFTSKRQGAKSSTSPVDRSDVAKKSGATTLTRGGAISQNDIIADYLAEPSFLGISAGRNQAVVDELGQDGHSLFTWALLESMKERAMMNRDDQVFLGRILAADVERRVASIRTSPQRVDWGYLDDGRGDFVFIPSTLRETPAQLSENRRKKLKVRQFVKDLGAAKLALDDGDREAALQILLPHLDDAELAQRFDARFIRNLAQSGTENSILTKANGDLFKPIKLPPGIGNHRYQYHSVATTNDGELLAAAEYIPLGSAGAFQEKRVVVFDTSGKLIAKYENHVTDITGLAFSPDGTQLAIARSKPIEFVGSNRELSAKEKKVASEIRIYEARTKKILMTLPAPELNIEGLAFSRDGAILVAGHNPHRIDLFVSNHASSVSFYDIWTGQRTFKMDVRAYQDNGQPPAVRRLKFSESGDQLAVSDDSDRQIWLATSDLPVVDSAKSAQLRKENGSFRVEGVPAWISDDGRTVGVLQFRTNSQDTTVSYRRFDTVTHKLVGTGGEQVAQKGFKEVSWVPVRNGYLAFQASVDRTRSNRPKTYLIWKLEDRNLTVHKWIPPANNLDELTFSPDGTLFVKPEKNSQYAIWSSINGGKICDLASRLIRKRELYWSQDSKKVIAEGDEPNQIQTWDATTGEILKSIDVYGSTGTLNSFKDTNIVLNYNDVAFSLFEGDRNNQARHIETKMPKFCTGVYLDPNMRRAVSRHQDETLFSWDFQIGSILSPLKLPEFQTPDIVRLTGENEVVVVGFDGWISRVPMPKLTVDQQEQLVAQPISRRSRSTENKEVVSNSIYRLLPIGSNFVRGGVSPDQNQLALQKLNRIGNRTECQIVIVETFSGKQLGEISTGTGWPSSVALGKNKSGRFCLYFLDGKLNFLNLETGDSKQLQFDIDGSVHACAVNSTGNLVATASTKTPKSNSRTISIFNIENNLKLNLGEVRACSGLKFDNGRMVCSGLNSHRPKTVWEQKNSGWKKESARKDRKQPKGVRKVLLVDDDKKPLLYINQSHRLEGKYLEEHPELKNRRAHNGCMTREERLFLLLGKKLHYEVEGLAEMKFFSLPLSTTAEFLFLSDDESTLAIGDRGGKLLLIDVEMLR